MATKQTFRRFSETPEQAASMDAWMAIHNEFKARVTAINEKYDPIMAELRKPFDLEMDELHRAYDAGAITGRKHRMAEKSIRSRRYAATWAIDRERTALLLELHAEEVARKAETH